MPLRADILPPCRVVPPASTAGSTTFRTRVRPRRTRRGGRARAGWCGTAWRRSALHAVCLTPTRPVRRRRPHTFEESEEDRRERLARLEAELNGLLERVRAAERLPFPGLSEALPAELRFMRAHPEIADGVAKYAAFQAEMQRLYAIEDEHDRF